MMTEADAIFANWRQGLYPYQSQVYRACNADPKLLGQVYYLIKEYRNGLATEVPCELNTITTSPPSPSNTTESTGVSGEGCCEGQTVRKRKQTPKKQSRRKVSKAVRVPDNEPEESEEPIPRYGCLQNCLQRLWSVRKFW